MEESPNPQTVRKLAVKIALDFVLALVKDRIPPSKAGFMVEEDHEAAIQSGHALPWAAVWYFFECGEHKLACEVATLLQEAGLEQCADPFPGGTAVAVYVRT